MRIGKGHGVAVTGVLFGLYIGFAFQAGIYAASLSGVSRLEAVACGILWPLGVLFFAYMMLMEQR